MLVKNVEVLISKIEVKQNSNTHADYLMIGILTLDDGTNFSIIEKDMNKLNSIRAMTKYRVNLKVNSSQYGINVSLEDILKEEGSIMDSYINTSNKDSKQ